LVSLFVGGRAIGAPTEARLRFLQSAPSLIAATALFGSGTGLWAVYLHVSAQPSEQVTLIGMLEAAQPLTLGGLLVAGVIALRMVAERRLPAAR
jgi:hypothetical protein